MPPGVTRPLAFGSTVILMSEGTPDTPVDIVLLAGLWLPSSIWDDVVRELFTLGHHPVAVDLPGVDDGDAAATLDDQLSAVLAAVDAAERPLVVGHSAASALAWLAADRRPEALRGVVMIGGFPQSLGAAYADMFPLVEGVMAFPGWEPFAGPDSDDLDADARQRIEAVAVPVPGGVASGTVDLRDEARFSVPITLVCPEFDPDDARAWIADGDLPELELAHVRFVDIESGHWPMVTRPAELARILASIASDAEPG